jgi:hypothetical protein
VGGLAPERPYGTPPSTGKRYDREPLAYRCFDLAEGDPELALLLALTAVRLGYVLDAAQPRDRRIDELEHLILRPSRLA